MFTLFDGAARALECAASIRDATARGGMQIRAGVHAGEVEVDSQGVRGLAVHEVARLAAHAVPDEILVSEATRALVAGSGMTFEDRGDHQLKGLDGTRHLYAYTR
jgi:class 3 adenylate cyclase